MLIAEICRETRDYDGALGYKDSIILFNDSLLRQKGSNLLSISQARLEIQQAQYDLTAKRARFNIIIIISVIILVVIAVLTVTIIKVRQTRIKYEEALMKKELSFRKNELMAKTLYISGRDQLLENLFESLHASGYEGVIPPAMMSKLKNHLTTTKDWDEFTKLFEQTNNGILKELKKKHPLLNANDMRFLILVSMNLSNKEIAGLLNITPDACRKRKERVSRKMGITSDLLYDYISKIGSNL